MRVLEFPQAQTEESFRDRLEGELDNIGDLPTLPTIVTALERALRSDETNAADVASIIAEDPSMTANVLRVANSAYYAALAGSISSVAGAVARLGFSEIRNLCTTIAVVRTFGKMGRQLNHRMFWKHSIVAAIATRVIGHYCHPAAPFSEDEAWVAGLLHDVGSLVLDQYFPDAFQKVRAAAEEQNRPYAEAEDKILKIDHGEVGGTLLSRWDLPHPIVTAVSFHHQPTRAEADDRPLVQAVHLADSICTSLGIGDGGDGIPAAFSNSAWYDLDLSVTNMPDIIEHVTQEANRCETLLSLI